ncbi:hypothetical protein [Halalkalibacter urbisdiaboli]|uniref:hypothetical protein n=1 Tax=Halalkalibacter urbisdiaboli TaxID=1960589 RepID=UPI000B432098|nr:hypothetical protein [Halalkalibacter urbisdiaboli]
MKKWLIIIGVLIVILGIVAVDSKFYYPTLPIESVSKKEVLESLNDTSQDIVKIAEENGYEWYITPEKQGKAHENLKNMINSNGWQFQQQEGSGYFFEKGDNTLIATTQMWTGNYVIVKIPKDWKE